MNILKKLPLPSSQTFLGYICGITASLFWGFHPVLIRYLTGEGVPPLGIASLRLLIGSGILTIGFLLFSLSKKQKLTSPSLPYGKFFWFAVFGLMLNFILFHQGLIYTIASDAILLEAFSPIIVLFFLILFLKERVQHLKKYHLLIRLLFIVLIGSVGSALLIVNSPKDLLLVPENKLFGDIIEFAAMFFFALYILASHEIQHRSPEQNPLKITAHILFFSGIILIPFVNWKIMMGVSSLQWIWIGVLGIFSTAFAYSLWQIAASYLDVVPLALLFSLSSVWNVAIESFVFDLNLSPKLIVGALLILTASIITQLTISKIARS